MKKLLFILFLIFINCSTKKERIENVMISCINNIEDEKGNKLESQIEDYEKLLLENNILESRSAKSYKNLFSRFIIKDNINIELNENDTLLVKIYSNRFYNITFQKIFKCFNDIDKDSLKYDSHKIKILKKKFEKLKKENNNFEDFEIAKLLNSNLDEKDFELDFYKSIVLEFLISYNSPPL